MNPESPVTFSSPAYLFKVVSGLALLATVMATALWLPLSEIPANQQRIGVALLLALTVAIIPFVRRVYGRADELQKLLHQKSSAATLVFLASVSGVIGILQASHLVPLFNQFWMLLLLVATWGVNLMLADRRFK